MGGMVLARMVALGLMGALAGCGGSVFSSSPGSTDSGAPDTSTNDAAGQDAGRTDGGVPWSPVCPDLPPKESSPCTHDLVECEYGARFDIACDLVMQCTGGEWHAQMLGFGGCPTPAPNPAACPPTAKGIPVGEPCPADTNDRCAYAEAVCTCSPPLMGGPIPVDGGLVATWSCLPEPGCPMPRPRLGSACSNPSQSCTYVACDYGQVCQSGVWQGQPEGCAQAGGGSGG